ncbi:MAG: hypothetical protein COV74_07275 [Candidatus Omnitrophica bacterium CG11_big_fil_rev_8_21_14_0_20_45_26]|uniref:FAD-binding PCMH-type domain-containing protein n=1 Tax=Candidatus Abzuiibacterium crystallinum TaxID=1974748 RepID=A0A2H0LN19_9BACT|nr:MAG: hypothetical protein COV74_07275 [Candidatus Omnitrophica bacterium CG11_big_fil_rev_8_21_14_0_20_45_26]PIW65500.1 MAG: FAD-binding oxidoreductase [Candidatus Omnitrophica bacterium CG12_big_fil_rev_8_21_14_0_65_45_16]
MITKTEPKIIENYLQDASLLKGKASGLILPESTRDISGILEQASRKREPMTVSGNRTGLTGAAVPEGGQILATDQLNRIQTIEAGFAVIEPGVTLEELQRETAKRHLMYPPDPGERKAFLGGNAATNASGPRAFKYGATRQWIRRLEVVLPTGEAISVRRGQWKADRLGQIQFLTKSGKEKKISLPRKYTLNQKLTKNSAGYFIYPEMDLIDLFIGAEGTLGVVTEIEVGLIPAPPHVLALVIFFRDEKDAWMFVREIKTISLANRFAKQAGQLEARAIEYFDCRSLQLIRPDYPHIPKHAQAAILIEQEYMDESDERTLMNLWYEIGRRFNSLASETWVANSEELREEFREFRHALPAKVNAWLRTHNQIKISTDMAVPSHTLFTLLDFQQHALAKEGLSYVTFGHIGDSHLHLNIMPKNDEERKRAKALYWDLMRLVNRLGGTISAEHGIGKLKREYFAEMVGREALQEMAALKKALDPSCILNRGNIVAEDFLV